MPTYKIVRKYQGDHPDELVDENLTLEEAQAHCSSKETSSRTCTSKEGRARTREFGEWFDCYYEED